ncbi:MAG TPA: APC family permease [Candidatus Cryosericum sp.]|nr:APC family permease [Candidatus Cryosericum sp.]
MRGRSIPQPARPRPGLGVLTLAGTIFIFVSSGPYGLESPVRDAGPGATLLMLVLALLFWGLSHVLVATELSSAVPEQGGFVRWIEMALGGFWGFQAAWWYWIKMLADTAIYPILFSEYLKYWTPGISMGEQRLVRMGLIWLVLAINLRGIRTGGQVALGLTLFLLAPFVLFIILGAPRLAGAPLPPLVAEGRTTLQGLGLALMFGMWCYNTLDSVSVVAGEVRDPARAYGRAYALVLPALLLGYVLSVAVGLAIDPAYASWQDHHFSTLGERLGGAWLGAWIGAGALLSNLSLFHGALMVNTRVPAFLAMQGRFPRFFARLGERSGAPWASLLFDACVYTGIALLVERFADIVVWNQWLNLGIYTLLYLSFLVLRRRRPDLPRPFKVPGGWAGAIAVCAGPFVICWLGVPIGGREMAWLGLAGLLSGPLAYGAFRMWLPGFRT